MSGFTSSISSFMANFDGGSRPNLFTFSLSVPGAGINFNNIHFFCRSTQLPTSTIGEVVVPYFGRQAKFPGDRTFEDFTVTVLNNQSMDLRKKFENWNQLFNSYSGNSTRYANPRKIFGTAVVAQLDRKYQPIRWYQFYDMFPRDVSSVDVGFDQNDTVSEFTVTFGYSYFEVGGQASAAQAEGPQTGINPQTIQEVGMANADGSGANINPSGAAQVNPFPGSSGGGGGGWGFGMTSSGPNGSSSLSVGSNGFGISGSNANGSFGVGANWG